MALSTYAELQAAVADWLHRDDLTTNIVDFIRLAEVQMSQDIENVRNGEATTTLTATGGNAYITLPTDFKSVIRLVLQANPNAVLKAASAEDIAADYPYGETNQSILYSVIGSQIQLAPIPDSNYDIILTYDQGIPALSDTNTTNWLLTRCPNAYLYGTCLQAQPYMINDARIATWEKMYASAITGLMKVDWNRSGPMRMRAR